MSIINKINCLYEMYGSPDMGDVAPSVSIDQDPNNMGFDYDKGFVKKEGGKAFSAGETGKHLSIPIKREYVDNTLKHVYDSLAKTSIIDMDSIQPMGSTLYKSKPELGDLDLLVKPKRSYSSLADFKNEIYSMLYTFYPIRDLAEKGRDFLSDEFSILVPIYDENDEITEDKAQCDLMLAVDEEDFNWKYYWYYSPKVSAYKASVKNYILGMIVKTRNYIFSKEGGLIDVSKSAPVTKDPKEMVNIIFGPEYTMNAILSVESLLAAIKDNPRFEGKYDYILNKIKEKVQEFEAAGEKVTKELTDDEQQQIQKDILSIKNISEYDNSLNKTINVQKMASPSTDW